MALTQRIGFGQVEPNHLSAQRTSQIYGQLPADDSMTILENGQFVKYDILNKRVNLTGAGEWMMVFNEVKLYDGWRESYKDFAMIKTNYTPGGTNTHYGIGPLDGQMTPRVIKTNVGDHYTTNCVDKANVDGKTVVTFTGNYAEGTLLGVDAATGYLVPESQGVDGTMRWQVVKVTDLADGQAAVKLLRVA